MPVVTIGENTADDFSGAEDAQIKSDSVTNNYGSKIWMEATKYAVGNHTHSLLSFSGLSNVPASTINDIGVFLWLVSASGAGDEITLKRLLVDWEEGSQNGADRQNDTPDSCCWNEYGSGNGWTTVGGLSDGNDRSATVSDTMAVGTTTGQYYEFTDAQLITDVSNFVNSVWSNYGWHLERTDDQDDNDYRTFMTSDGTDGNRPYIEVDYTVAGGISIPVVMYHLREH